MLVSQESIKMATKIEQFSCADRVATLTHQYLELGLPLNSALRAAEADLWEPQNLGLVIQSGPSSTKRCPPIRKDILPPNVQEYPALTADRYRPHPQVGNQPGNNTAGAPEPLPLNNSPADEK